MVGRQEMMDVLRKKSSEELLEKVATGFYDEKQEKIARFIIEEREKGERKQEFKKMLGATKANADSTDKLVKATWALFKVTALIATISLFGIFFRGCIPNAHSQTFTTDSKLKVSIPFGKEHDYNSIRVSRVVDGDTLKLENGERVRLIGVDTPETVHPTKPVEYFGKEASAFTKRLCEGKNVRLEFDQTERDKYDRLLAYVYLEDGTFLNAEIIKQGYGHAYTKFPFKYMEEFRQYEREAIEQKKGLWK